jgi:hypothetical protein
VIDEQGMRDGHVAVSVPALPAISRWAAININSMYYEKSRDDQARENASSKCKGNTCRSRLIVCLLSGFGAIKQCLKRVFDHGWFDAPKHNRDAARELEPLFNTSNAELGSGLGSRLMLATGRAGE